MRVEDRDTACQRLLQCLMPEGPTRDDLYRACMAAFEAGAIPFEVVVGAPADRILPRITFAAPKRRRELAEALGVPDHPWGPPDSIGLRPSPHGGIVAKGYHRITAVPEEMALPAELEAHLLPLVAAPLPEPEMYARWTGPPAWHALHSACERVLGVTLPTPSPRPEGSRGALGLSLRKLDRGGFVPTAYADHTALPPDDELRRSWGASLSAEERQSFERALAGTRSIGPREGGSWFDFLAWGVDERGRSWQAVSLRLPWPSAPADGDPALDPRLLT